MSKRTKAVSVIAIVTLLVAAAFLVGTAVAQKVTPKPQDKLAIGEAGVKQLLVLMQSDKHGKVSKQEFMEFMEAEFQRLDKDNSGELDVKELTQLNYEASSHYAGR
jgi:EF hand